MKSVHIYTQLVEELELINRLTTNEGNRLTGWYAVFGLVMCVGMVFGLINANVDPGFFMIGLTISIMTYTGFTVVGCKHAAILRRKRFAMYDDQNLSIVVPVVDITGVPYNHTMNYIDNLLEFKRIMEQPTDDVSQ